MLMNKNDSYLLNKGLAITFITNFIDFQTNILSRDKSDKDSIETTCKTVFNAMMNNGDIEYSDWDIIKNKLKEVRYQTKKEMQEEVKKEYLVSTFSAVCENCRDFKGRPIEETIGVENISSFSKDNKISKTTTELLALIKYRNEITRELNKKISSLEELKLEESIPALINKYGNLFPENYSKSLGVIFNE